MSDAHGPSPAAPPGGQIVFEGVSKTYPDGTRAVTDLDLEVRSHELMVLVGPSGCGKSTTMRMVNRLVEPSTGRILLDGVDIAGLDPGRLRRDIGYVIQHVGLFPHRTVARNVATVPRLLGWPAARIAARVDELLELVGLDPEVHGRRYPHQLSGGQRQRVGVARALAAEPRVLLMDEPFGAVDPVGRRHLQDEFRRLHQRLQPTVMFVTHDIDEAVLLGDRVAVFSQGGRLEQVADPVSLLTQPATDAVRSFIGKGSAVRLLGLAAVEVADLAPLTGPAPTQAGGLGELTVAVGATLGEAFAAVAESSSGRVPALDGDGHVVGEVTPEVIHRVLRRIHGEPDAA
ncbi:MAG: ATP-binding cassette domain-containing protein [Candidatus Nanopelagicales bacterium]